VRLLHDCGGELRRCRGRASFPAPIVAGVAALVISANPGLTPAQMMVAVSYAADDMAAPGWGPTSARGASMPRMYRGHRSKRTGVPDLPLVLA
jgi:subtilisin family serine protease